MGSVVGAEICKLVNNLLPQKLSEKYKRKNLALYHDDGLAIFKNVSGPASKKTNNILENYLKIITLSSQFNAIQKS